jgi:hypothetical protein
MRTNRPVGRVLAGGTICADTRETTKFPPECPGPIPGNFGSGSVSNRTAVNRFAVSGSSIVYVSLAALFSAKTAPSSRIVSSSPAFDLADCGLGLAHFGLSASPFSHSRPAAATVGPSSLNFFSIAASSASHAAFCFCWAGL